MNRYEIKGTKSSPRVLYDFDNGILNISGKSFGSSPYEFYTKLTNILDLYKVCDKLDVTIDLEHTNTVSSKHLLGLMNSAKSKFLNLEVIWVYELEDQDLLELGYTFYEILNVPFQFKSK